MKGNVEMSPALLIIVVIAAILLITGGIIKTLNFLIWIAVVLFVVAVISYLIQSISKNRSNRDLL